MVWSKNIASFAQSQKWLEGYSGNIHDAQLELEYLESQLLLYLSEHGDHYLSRLTNPIPDPNHPTINVVAPKDPTARSAIDRLAKLVAEHGAPFEATFIQNLQSSSEHVAIFRTLFFSANLPLRQYYCWRVFAFTQMQSTRVWSTRAFQMTEGGAWWIPPQGSAFDASAYLVGELKRDKVRAGADMDQKKHIPAMSVPEEAEHGEALSEADSERFAELIRSLDLGKKKTFCRVTLFVMQRASK